MGEGNYRPAGAITRQYDPFDDIDETDACARTEAWEDLITLVRTAGGPRLVPIDRVWRDRHARVIGATGLHDITLYENSSATVFITVWPRRDLDTRLEALARAGLERTAEALFRRLSVQIELRIATSAWTSARWVPRARAGARA